MYSIEYIPQIYQDLKQITQWYSEHRQGLDDEFLLSLEASLLLIKRKPFQFKEKIGGRREILMHRFPFRVIYRVDATKIIVLGIFHTKRNPKLLRQRVK